MKIILSSIIVACTMSIGMSQNIVFDSTFGVNGRVYRDIGNGQNIYANTILLQPDHKIIVAGKAGSKFRFFPAVRYLANGRIDEDFDCSSIEYDLPQSTTEATCMALQTDQKIVVGGYYGSNGTDFALYRMQPDGRPDSSFGNNGVVLTDFDFSNAVLKGIAIQPSDGKIVAVGYADGTAGFDDITVARYLPTGALDATFANDGIFTLNEFYYDDRANAVAIQPDGKILVGGYSDWGGAADYTIIRLDLNGKLDLSFNSTGIITTNLGNLYDDDYIQSLILLNDGSIIACGTSELNFKNVFSAAKYKPDGQIDTEFGINGIFRKSITTNTISPQSGGLGPDGKIWLCGSEYVDPNWQIIALRLNPNGAIDSTFANQGIFTNNMPNHNYCLAVICETDGKAILTGLVRDITGIAPQGSQIILVKLTSNGTIDQQFGTNGITINGLKFGEDGVSSICQTSDGKFILAGHSANNKLSDVALVKYNPDGSPDFSFSCNGEVTLRQFHGNHYGNSVAIQDDEKIIVCGYSLDGTNESLLICRTFPDGTIDESFGTNGFFSYSNAYGRKIVYIPATGKIYAAGKDKIFRLNTNGALDNTFNSNGVAISTIDIYDFIVKPDGSLIVAGRIKQGNKYVFGAQYFYQNGSADATFGGAGTAIIPVGTGNSYAYDVEFQNDKILLAGYSQPSVFNLVRLTIQGLPDNSFDGDGIVLTPGAIGYVNTIMPQSNGKIILGGDGNNGTTLTCYNYDGTLYPTFGTNGIVNLGFSVSCVGMVDLGNNYFAIVGGHGNQEDFGMARLKGVNTTEVNEPCTLSSFQIQPNPANSAIVLNYMMSKGEEMSITIFDMLGRKVQTLFVNQYKPAGTNQDVITLPEQIPPGNYILLCSSNTFKKSFLLTIL